MKFIRIGKVCVDIHNIIYAYSYEENGCEFIEIEFKDHCTENLMIQFDNEEKRNIAFDKICEKLENYTV